MGTSFVDALTSEDSAILVVSDHPSSNSLLGRAGFYDHRFQVVALPGPLWIKFRNGYCPIRYRPVRLTEETLLRFARKLGDDWVVGGVKTHDGKFLSVEDALKGGYKKKTSMGRILAPVELELYTSRSRHMICMASSGVLELGQNTTWTEVARLAGRIDSLLKG